jgi:hypothetical protein
MEGVRTKYFDSKMGYFLLISVLGQTSSLPCLFYFATMAFSGIQERTSCDLIFVELFPPFVEIEMTVILLFMAVIRLGRWE